MHVFIGLGSNLGDRMHNLEVAVHRIEDKCKLIKKSSIYETEPKYFANQPNFLNMVIEVETELDPYELLEFLQLDEKHLGRNKETEERNCPRIIDLDILYYKGLEVETERLTIPHPRMTERAFVMIPLMEIAPKIKIRGLEPREIIRKMPKEEIEGVKKITNEVQPSNHSPAKPLDEGHNP
ncbi:MAG: 2-amino-4-hydroxy-6-hydroxymethyldihydropteridine diphosphokinase [Candidatus Micrarchaeota archaeon]